MALIYQHSDASHIQFDAKEKAAQTVWTIKKNNEIPLRKHLINANIYIQLILDPSDYV